MNITVTDQSGAPLNLSGYNASGHVYYSYGSTGYLLDLAPIIDPSYVSGIINVSVPWNSTTGLPITKAIYNIEAYGISGCAFPIMQGYAEILPMGCVGADSSLNFSSSTFYVSIGVTAADIASL